MSTNSQEKPQEINNDDGKSIGDISNLSDLLSSENTTPSVSAKSVDPKSVDPKSVDAVDAKSVDAKSTTSIKKPSQNIVGVQKTDMATSPMQVVSPLQIAPNASTPAQVAPSVVVVVPQQPQKKTNKYAEMWKLDPTVDPKTGKTYRILPVVAEGIINKSTQMQTATQTATPYITCGKQVMVYADIKNTNVKPIHIIR